MKILNDEELAKILLNLKWKELHDVFLCSRDKEVISDYGSCLALAQAIRKEIDKNAKQQA